MSDLYEKIDALCAGKEISIGKMCSLAGINQGKITDLKKDRRKTITLSTAQKIAAALDVPISALTDEPVSKWHVSDKLQDAMVELRYSMDEMKTFVAVVVAARAVLSAWDEQNAQEASK